MPFPCARAPAPAFEALPVCPTLSPTPAVCPPLAFPEQTLARPHTLPLLSLHPPGRTPQITSQPRPSGDLPDKAESDI